MTTLVWPSFAVPYDPPRYGPRPGPPPPRVHDPVVIERGECAHWRRRDEPRRTVRPAEVVGRYRKDATCGACTYARARERTRAQAAVRQRPGLPDRPPRHCRWCGRPVEGRRQTWCSDECVDWWSVCTSTDRMRDHLVDLHGSGCWECGETIGPGWTIWSGWEPRDVESLYLRDHGPPEPGPIVLHVDHIRPLWSLTDEERRELRWWLPFNLQLLCAACHAAKTAREARERAQVRRGERRAG